MRLFLTYRQSTISYLRLGTGKQLLFCFHGFGDRAIIWTHLAEKLGDDFTLIALDLPFHGQTNWCEKTIQMADFEWFIKEISIIENQTRFSLAGFSFGARIVQKLLFSHEENIDRLLFFAPDGMGTKGLKNATLVPKFFRRAAQFLLQKPDKLIQFVHWLHQKRWVSKGVYWFFSYNIAHTKRRERIFFYWLCLNDFEVKLDVFKKHLQESRIPTHIFLGKNDDITPLSIGPFLASNAPNVKLHIVESGHQILANLPDFDI
jgi:pimeloyl-ACP methyl ester carboxylesterase